MPERADERPPITDRTIGAYLDALGSSAPTPGGGSAAGLIGALGAGLGLMVVSLTNDDDPEATSALETAGTELRRLQARFTALAEDDEQVFQRYQDAAAMPKRNPEEKQARRAALQEGLKHAAGVPLEMATAAVELAEALDPVLAHGNPHLQSDARIALQLARACFEASRINVEVNLAMIRDEPWVDATATRLDSLAADFGKASTR